MGGLMIKNRTRKDSKFINRRIGKFNNLQDLEWFEDKDYFH